MATQTTVKKQVKRRPKQRPAVVRGEAVVQGVLQATIEELAHAGYGALRVEDVATRAGVNKTTIYRRWPLKSDLVQAALFSFAQDVAKQPDTGSLRGDLMELGRGMAGAACTAHGQGMFRVLMAERHPDLMAIERSLRKTFEVVPLSVVQAAVNRGELRPGLDPRVLLETFIGALHHRVFMKQETADDPFITRVVDLVLHGALKR
ncbi:MAG: TetR/AcrR family transcriptional regulator [Minicystis sp.]